MYNEKIVEVLLFRFLDSQIALDSTLIINNIYSALSLNTASFMYSNIVIISPCLLYQIDTRNSHLQYQTIKSCDSLNCISHRMSNASVKKEGSGKPNMLGWEKAAGISGTRPGLRLSLRRLVLVSTRDFHNVQKLGLSSKNSRQMHRQVSDYLQNHNLEILILLFQLCKAEANFSLRCSLARQQRNWR